MSLGIEKVLLALIAFGVIYLIIAEDEPAVPKEVKQLGRIEKPAVIQYPKPPRYSSRNRQYSQTPVAPKSYSDPFEHPLDTRQNWNSRFPQYRFRPLDEDRNKTTPYQSDTQQQQSKQPAFFYDLPGYRYPDNRNRKRQSSPGKNSERFRPLDEKRQLRRWQGSYRRMSRLPEQLVAPRRSIVFPVLTGPT